jgi:hypothetical protein
MRRRALLEKIIGSNEPTYNRKDVLIMGRKGATNKEDDFFTKLEKEYKAKVVQVGEVRDISQYCECFGDYTDEEMDDLKNDIAVNGVLSPVILMGKPHGGYLLIDGRHRLKACEDLVTGCPAHVYEELSPEEQARLAFSGNRKHRKGQTRDWKKKRVLELYNEFKWGYQKLANCIENGKKSTVRNWIQGQKKNVPNGTPNEPEKLKYDAGYLKKTLDSISKRVDKTQESIQEYLNKISIIKGDSYGFAALSESKDQLKDFHQKIKGYQDLFSELADSLDSLLQTDVSAKGLPVDEVPPDSASEPCAEGETAEPNIEGEVPEPGTESEAEHDESADETEA